MSLHDFPPLETSPDSRQLPDIVSHGDHVGGNGHRPFYFNTRSKTFLLLLIGVLLLGACNSQKPGADTPTSSPAKTTTPIESSPAPVATVLFPPVEPLPEGLDLLQRLILNKTIVVGLADNSAQTMSVTIPSMF